MSITFNLYKVLPDVYYLGEKNNYEKIFSDGIIHDLLDVTYIKMFATYNHRRSCKGFLRMAHRLIPLCNSRVTNGAITSNIIVVDKVLCHQGWFIRSGWCNKECTLYYAITKNR